MDMIRHKPDSLATLASGKGGSTVDWVRDQQAWKFI